MEQLIQFFEENYFSSLVLILISLTAICIGVIRRKKFPFLKFIPAYIGLSLTQSIFNCALFFTTSHENKQIIYSVNNHLILVFIIFETLVFNQIFITRIANQYVVYVIRIHVTIFILFTLYQAIFSQVGHKLFAQVYTFESACLLIPCLYYYFELLIKKPSILPSQEPLFWITTGLLSLVTVTLPYAVVQDNIASINTELFDSLQTVVYVGYIIFFSLLIKAYMCKPPCPNNT